MDVQLHALKIEKSFPLQARCEVTGNFIEFKNPATAGKTKWDMSSIIVRIK